MKRIAVLFLITVIVAVIWAGFMVYRIHRDLAHRRSAASVALQTPSGASPNSSPSGNSAESPAAQGLPDMRGKPAPAFTLMTPDGKSVSLADYRGKAVLLNFWGTWCGPCKLEIPWLIDLQKKYAAQGFTVLGVAENEESPKDVTDYAAKMRVNYPLLMADGKINKAYSCCDFVPTSYYIGRNGKVVAEVGGIVSASDIEANIHKALAAKGT